MKMKSTVVDERESEAVENIGTPLPAEVAERGVWHRPVVTVMDLTRTMVAQGAYLDG